jgi:hypothetical protein
MSVRLPIDSACASLLRALRPHAAPFILVSTASRPWASALFLGSRHRLTLRLEGEDANSRATRLQAALGEMELEIPGGFVADILVTSRVDGDTPALGIEALTIYEPEIAETPEAAPVSSAASRAG